MIRLAVLLAVVLLAAAPRPAPVIPADSLGSVIPRVGVEPDQERTGAPTADTRSADGIDAQSSRAPSESGRAGAAGAPPSPLYAVALGQGALTTGHASWYADPRKPQGSLYAAAGPALRRALGSRWRGATVRVCSAYSVPPRQLCITTRLGDYCVCRPSTIIDLSWRAFSDRRIGLGVPLWRGVVRVTVSRA